MAALAGIQAGIGIGTGIAGGMLAMDEANETLKRQHEQLQRAKQEELRDYSREAFYGIINEQRARGTAITSFTGGGVDPSQGGLAGLAAIEQSARMAQTERRITSKRVTKQLHNEMLEAKRQRDAKMLNAIVGMATGGMGDLGAMAGSIQPSSGGTERKTSDLSGMTDVEIGKALEDDLAKALAALRG